MIIIDPESLCYAPSTIALSVLLLTFSKLRVNCGEWLHCLPDECLPPKAVFGTDDLVHPVFNNDEISYLNIDMCIVSLQKVHLPVQRKISYHEYDSSSHDSSGPFNSPPPKNLRMEPLKDGRNDQIRLTPTSTADLEL
jgi:hypothetical protein